MFPPMTPLTERVRIEFEQRQLEQAAAVPSAGNSISLRRLLAWLRPPLRLPGRPALPAAKPITGTLTTSCDAEC
ncbi:MAG: hypothetical protein DWB42_06220 [Chloroflexi bacterium]|nr:hypothetical protein [Chloroflexota bacterium]MDL1885391.1 hypothetical protein [Anaerolineae bacterium CFX8]